jgi:hypothetical protein
MKSKFVSILAITFFMIIALGCTVAVAPVNTQSGEINWAFLLRQEVMGVKVAVPLFNDSAEVDVVEYEGDNVIFVASKMSEKDSKIGIRFTHFGKLSCNFDVYIMNEENDVGLKGDGSMSVGSDIRYVKNAEGLVTGVKFMDNDVDIKIKGFSVEKLLFDFDKLPTGLSIMGGSKIMWNEPGVYILD